MENGRCYAHGGRSPKGDAWHKPVLPIEGARFHAKIADLQARKARQDRRREAMGPEERERHEHWRRTHKPGSKAARAAARETRRQNAEAKAIFSAPRREMALNPKIAALGAREKELRQLMDELERRERERRLMEVLFG